MSAAEVLPGVFVGPATAGRDAGFLSAAGIQRVVCLVPDVAKPANLEVEFRSLPLEDAPDADLGSVVDAVLALRQEGGGRRMLVHCQAGISRSPAVCVALAMRHLDLRFEAALAHVRCAYPDARPNSGFVKQLRALPARWALSAGDFEGVLRLDPEPKIEIQARAQLARLAGDDDARALAAATACVEALEADPDPEFELLDALLAPREGEAWAALVERVERVRRFVWETAMQGMHLAQGRRLIARNTVAVERHPLRPHPAWVCADGGWVPFRPEEAAPEPLRRLATWNVWFDSHRWDGRQVAIADELRAADADVIGLQEVTQPFLDALLAQRWVRDAYVSSHIQPTRHYGSVLLVRKRLRPTGFLRIDLPTGMDRDVVVAQLGDGSVVAATHLESTMRETERRLRQLSVTLPQLEGLGPAFLIGDMNFGARAHEDTLLQDRGWRDSYTERYGGDTMKRGRLPAWRPDRVFSFPCASTTLPPTIERVLGNFVLPGPTCSECVQHPCTPSDHFGLVVAL